MATQTLPQSEVQESKKSATQYVYSFGGGKADGNGKMKDDLGGKGRRPGRDDECRPARASGLHHPDRSLPRIHAHQRRFGGS